jgi:hypothetical protein
VLGGEVEEGEQRLGVVDDLGHRLGPLGPELVCEGVDGTNGVLAVLGVTDLGQGPAGRGLDRGGKAVEAVGDLVHPAPLRSGLGEHLAQRTPEPEGSVAHGQHRCPHAAAAQVPHRSAQDSVGSR